MPLAWNNLGDLRYQYNLVTFKISMNDFLNLPSPAEVSFLWFAA